jgi:hypothetical protein
MLKNSQGISENEELIGMGIPIIQNAHMILDRYPPDTTEHQTQNNKENRVQSLHLVIKALRLIRFGNNSKGFFPLGCYDHSSLMESHLHRALFLVTGTVPFHCRAASGLTSGNTSSYEEKDRIFHFMMSFSFTHTPLAPPVISQYLTNRAMMTVSTASKKNIMD